ncbi:MAG: hypothetical protein AAFS10_22155, partial [Myxococcota bacterium]
MDHACSSHDHPSYAASSVHPALASPHTFETYTQALCEHLTEQLATPFKPSLPFRGELPATVQLLGERLGLDWADMQAIALATAPHLDPEVACLYGVIADTDNAPIGLSREVLAYMTGQSLFQLEHSYGALLLGSAKSLRMGLLGFKQGLFVPTPQLRSCLAGRSTLPDDMTYWAEHMTPIATGPIMDDLQWTTIERVRLRWSSDRLPPLTVIYGPSGVGRTMTATYIANARPMDLITVDLKHAPPEANAYTLEREALWLGAALLLRVPSSGLDERWRHQLHNLLQSQVPLMISADPGCHLGLSTTARSFVRIDLDRPSLAVRQRLWRHYLPRRVRQKGLTDETLAVRFGGVGRDIVRLARMAMDEAGVRGAPGSRPQVTLELLSSLVHKLQSGGLSGLGR